MQKLPFIFLLFFASCGFDRGVQRSYIISQIEELPEVEEETEHAEEEP